MTTIRTHLAKLFQSLEEVCSDYEKKLGYEDRLFWWTERTMVGASAIAANKLGWQSIQEYHGGNKGEKARWVDLWLSTKSKEEILFEAKYTHYLADSVHNNISPLDKGIVGQLLKAIKQLAAMDDYGETWIITLYAVPKFKGDIPPSNDWVKDARNAFESKIPAALPRGCVAHPVQVYNTPNRKIKNTKAHDGTFKPGFVVVTIEVDKKQARRWYRPKVAKKRSQKDVV